MEIRLPAGATLEPATEDEGHLRPHDGAERPNTRFSMESSSVDSLFRLSDSVVRAKSPEEIYEIALDTLQSLLHADMASILLFDDGGVMRFKAWRELTPEYRQAVEGHSPWSREEKDPEPVAVADVEEDRSLVPYLGVFREEGIRSLAFIPLVDENRLLGKFMIYYREPHDYAQEEVLLASTIANYVAFALNRRQQEERLKLYREIFLNSNDGIGIIRLDGTYMDQNPAHAQLLGFSSEELGSITPASHLGEDKFQEVAEALAAEGTFRGEVRSRTSGGEELDVELSAFSVSDEHGQPQYYVGMKRDIGVRKQAEKALRESEERFRTLADAAPVAIWVSDADGRCTWFNKGWLEFTGRTLEQESGYGWAEGMHPDDLKKWQQSYDSLFRNKESFEVEYRLKRRDGVYRWVLDRGHARYSADGEFLGYVGGCIDINDRKEAAEKVKLLNHELELRVVERTKELAEANRELQMFAYSIAHDMRQYLRSIVIDSRTIVEDKVDQLDADGRSDLLRLGNNARHACELVDGLLEFTRLGRSELEKSQVDLTQLAQTIAAELSSIKDRGEFSFRISPGMSCEGDARLLQVALHNLMDNAAKYRDYSVPTQIEIACAPGEEETLFYVRDQGAGFESGEAERIFEAFYRGGSAVPPGTGLGLASVKRIIERHGGRVWAQGELGRGATFYFTLPRASCG